MNRLRRCKGRESLGNHLSLPSNGMGLPEHCERQLWLGIEMCGNLLGKIVIINGIDWIEGAKILLKCLNLGLVPVR
jgi:hypothetical protein